MDFNGLFVKPKKELNLDRILVLLNKLKNLLFIEGVDPDWKSNICRPSFAMKTNYAGHWVDCLQVDPEAERFDIITATLRISEGYEERKVLTDVLLAISGYKDLVDMKADGQMIPGLVYETIETAIDILKIVKTMEEKNG